MQISSLSLPSRRTLLIIGFVLLVFIIGFLLYIFFFRSILTTTPPDETPTDVPIGGLPPTTSGGVPIIVDLAPGELPDAIARGGITETTIITINPVSNISQISGTEIAYYNQLNGQFFTLGNNGEIRALSDRTFPKVDSVAWSNSDSKAIIEFPDGANIVYDFDTDTQITLPKHWTDFEYAPTSNEILFKSIGFEPENNFLTISNENGTGARIIEPMGAEADRVNILWSPNNQILANYADPLDAGRQEVTFIGKNNENFLQLTINGYNFDSIWNPNGSQLLYEVTSEETQNNPQLWIVNAQPGNIGSGRRPLGIETNVSKCIFEDTQILYCAVPQYLPEGSGLFPSLAVGIIDDIYKINVETGSASLLAKLDIPLSIDSLLLSPDSRYLYFTDSYSGTLRKIKIR